MTGIRWRRQASTLYASTRSSKSGSRPVWISTWTANRRLPRPTMMSLSGTATIVDKSASTTTTGRPPTGTPASRSQSAAYVSIRNLVVASKAPIAAAEPTTRRATGRVGSGMVPSSARSSTVDYAVRSLCVALCLSVAGCTTTAPPATAPPAAAQPVSPPATAPVAGPIPYAEALARGVGGQLGGANRPVPSDRGDRDRAGRRQQGRRGRRPRAANRAGRRAGPAGAARVPVLHGRIFTGPPAAGWGALPAGCGGGGLQRLPPPTRTGCSTSCPAERSPLRRRVGAGRARSTPTSWSSEPHGRGRCWRNHRPGGS